MFKYRKRFIILTIALHFHSRLVIKSEASIWNLKKPVFSASTEVIQRCSALKSMVMIRQQLVKLSKGRVSYNVLRTTALPWKVPKNL